MALYGGGEPVKSVAFQLGISEETAKSYLKRIREKYRVAGIDVGTKVALRRRAIDRGAPRGHPDEHDIRMARGRGPVAGPGPERVVVEPHHSSIGTRTPSRPAVAWASG